MAPRTKRQRLQEKQEKQSSSEEEGSTPNSSKFENSDDNDDEALSDDILEIDFEVAEPTQDDYHGIRNLLTGFLDGTSYAVSELTDAVIEQATKSGIGSIIKCGDEGGPIGFFTALRLGNSSAWLKDLKSFCLSKPLPIKTKRTLEEAWESKSSILFLGERVFNCPHQLSAPLFRSILEELKVAAISPDKCIYIGRAFKEEDGYLQQATPEGEALIDVAKLTYDFESGAVGQGRRRVVAVVDGGDLQAALQKLEDLVKQQ